MKNIVSYAEIEKYPYLQYYKRKLYIGITRCYVIRERLEQSIPYVKIFTLKALAQQSTTCVRNAQHAKY